ncbi:MAG: zeta toxin family protein [Betaproteobacteria bacterium]
MKKVIIIAGPNGAGKTTFARNFLPKEAQTYQFINADLIAAGLSPFNPDLAAFKAGRIMLSEIEAVSLSGHNFAFETTLSGVHYLTQIKRWQNLGYTVKLWFIKLSTSELAIERVKSRVKQGGHDIPHATILRRFTSGLKNLEKFKLIVDSWVIFDCDVDSPKLIDWSANEH